MVVIAGSSAAVSQLRIGTPSAEHFPVDDVVADRLAVEYAQDVLHGGNAHTVDRFARDAGDMRGGNEIGQGQQRIVLRVGSWSKTSSAAPAMRFAFSTS